MSAGMAMPSRRAPQGASAVASGAVTPSGRAAAIRAAACPARSWSVVTASVSRAWQAMASSNSCRAGRRAGQSQCASCALTHW